jgi:hypothetical protein
MCAYRPCCKRSMVKRTMAAVSELVNCRSAEFIMKRQSLSRQSDRIGYEGNVTPSRAAKDSLQHPFLGIAGCTQGRDDFGDMVGAAGFHGDFDRGLTQAYTVIGAVVVRLDDIGAMLG